MQDDMDAINMVSFAESYLLAQKFRPIGIRFLILFAYILIAHCKP